MKFIYSLGIRIYYLLILFASLFYDKAKKWIKGRKHLFEKLKNVKLRNVWWFHVSSLGEFEQARPLIEKIKTIRPEQSILLTFFSPSGYEIRKNYKYADLVTYIPLDTAINARKFIDVVSPKMVFFAKYDFWFNFLMEIKKREIPAILFSAVFYENHIFFKWFGKPYLKVLSAFTHIFVQDKKSEALLKVHGFKNVETVGDTRIDRVVEIARRAKDFPVIKKFCSEKFCIVAGSTWQEDEKFLIPFINEVRDVKMIIAPHDISEKHITSIIGSLKVPYCRYSVATDEKLSNTKVLIIDNIGLLAYLYAYGNIAYVGGGFGHGIHNILEPAVFGLPIIFGPRYEKFVEAVELVKLKGAFVVNTFSEFFEMFEKLKNDEVFYKKTSSAIIEYIENNTGSTEKILFRIFSLH